MKFFNKPILILISIIIPVTIVLAKSPDYKQLNIENVSRYNEDRLAFQHIEKSDSEYKDNSIESLLIIKNNKMYLISDGYDSLKEVKTQALLIEMKRELVDIETLWKNKINGTPDYIKITDRRIEVLRNFDEKFVSEKFGNFYTTIKTAFLKRHISIFRQLMVNRKDSEFKVSKKPIPSTVVVRGDSKRKYSTEATAKTKDGKVYFVEDGDGDGIAETFSVSILDGFTWGIKSGPNVIFIYKNTKKDIQDLIGKLSHEAFYGTPEEEKSIIDTLPKNDEIIELINDLIPDEKFYK